MGKILPWPVKLSHKVQHMKMLDHFMEIINQYNDALESYPEETKEHIPRLKDNSIDYCQISIYELYNWISAQAINPDHTHENGESNEPETKDS